MSRAIHPIFCLPAIMLLLSACTQPVPEHLDISPTITIENSEQVLNQNINLLTQDLRSHRYIISVHQGDQELAKLVNLEHSLRADIDQKLRSALSQYQISFDPNSKLKVQLDVLDLSAKVKQLSVSHNVKSDMRIKVSVTTPAKSVAKQYQSSFDREGAMQVDLKKVESEMGLQLSELLNRMVNDPELLELLENQA